MSTTIDKVEGFEYPVETLSSKIVKYKGRTDFMNYLNIEDVQEFIKRVKADYKKELICDCEHIVGDCEPCEILNKHAGDKLID